MFCFCIMSRLKTRVRWIRNWWTKKNRFVFPTVYCVFNDTDLSHHWHRLKFSNVAFFSSDTKYCILCGEAFGNKLYLQYNVQLGIEYWLWKFFTYHLINNECKSHSVLSREQHSGVCYRYVCRVNLSPMSRRPPRCVLFVRCHSGVSPLRIRSGPQL